MLLTLTSEAEQATDLGYLLHKNPANLYEKEMSFGTARVFYPEASATRCTAALLLEVDPIALVRGRNATLDQYVNDRPYVASSLLSVALGEVFSTALSGRCSAKPELVGTQMPLQATLAVVDCDGGEDLIRRLFEPLGYTVTVERAILDPRFPQWGESDLYTVTVAAHQTVQNLLAHLYILIPVLDNTKHYFVDTAEIDKLLRRGEGWLAEHPEKNLITRRYLLYRHQMVRQALAALDVLRDETAPTEADAAAQEAEEQRVEERIAAPVRLNDTRMEVALEAVRATPPPLKRVLDLGCGEGNLLRLLLNESGLEQIVGIDVSPYALERAEQRLKLDRLPERKREKLQLLQGSVVYRDSRFSGFDAAVLIEVIEHLDAPRLAAMEQVVFRYARPRRVVVTTPNAEYNTTWPSLPAGKFRHRDHRFEWTRAEFQAWSSGVAATHGYTVTWQGIGPEDAALGSPTQMAIFDIGEG